MTKWISKEGGQVFTTDDMAASACVDLSMLRQFFPTNVCALHAQQTEHKPEHAQRQRPHEQTSHYLDVHWRHVRREDSFVKC